MKDLSLSFWSHRSKLHYMYYFNFLMNWKISMKTVWVTKIQVTQRRNCYSQMTHSFVLRCYLSSVWRCFRASEFLRKICFWKSIGLGKISKVQFRIVKRTLLPGNDWYSSIHSNEIMMFANEPYFQGTRPSNSMQVPHRIVFETLKVYLDSCST